MKKYWWVVAYGAFMTALAAIGWLTKDGFVMSLAVLCFLGGGYAVATSLSEGRR